MNWRHNNVLISQKGQFSASNLYIVLIKWNFALLEHFIHEMYVTKPYNAHYVYVKRCLFMACFVSNFLHSYFSSSQFLGHQTRSKCAGLFHRSQVDSAIHNSHRRLSLVRKRWHICKYTYYELSLKQWRVYFDSLLGIYDDYQDGKNLQWRTIVNNWIVMVICPVIVLWPVMKRKTLIVYMYIKHVTTEFSCRNWRFCNLLTYAIRQDRTIYCR
jgi:hypothetical protein